MQEGPQTGALPGEDLIGWGIRDLERGVESAESFLVSIGAPRLRRLGLTVPTPLPDPEQRLYLLLRERHGDAAHSRYNSLVRRLVSFERMPQGLREMSELADTDRIERFMHALGAAAARQGTCYLTGGATAVLHGWR